MQLLDFNQVCISNLMVQLGNHVNSELDEAMLRHMVLNTIRSLRSKFKMSYGELIICIDDRHQWRRDAFPYYKANRRKGREESELDWATIFDAFGHIRAELKETFPYRVLQIPGAEADDIIASLCMEYGRTDYDSQLPDWAEQEGEPILILSGDKDYIQLHTYGNVKQWNPVLKKYVVHPDPEEYKREHILKGDKGDGVPNVLMPDDSIVMGTRSKPMTTKKLTDLRDINSMSTEVRRNYERNKLLIDLTQVPEKIREQVREQMAAPIDTSRKRLLDYFIKHKLSMLMENIGDF